ncbi:MAG: inositol monophosphatase [Verrucomicrobiota bacterium]|nr:inositol monophosphatase [Verrucomicrobiota bacterium]
MQEFLELATRAAREAGESLRKNFHEPLRVNSSEAHDIKLEIDVETQELITRRLLGEFPAHALYGEEGIVGDQSAEYQWIVDPIDGTVNYFYGIPHFCISIALRRHGEIIVGVIYDPMRDELWATRAGAEATLNGKPFRVSTRTKLEEAVVSVGLSKSSATISAGLPLLSDLVHRVRKCRLLGSAALDMAYVACGRFDAYIEQGISLWDVAAGILLVQNAGGKIEMRERTDMKDKYSIIASNGVLDLPLSRP